MLFNINHMQTVIGTVETEMVLGMEFIKEVTWNDEAPIWLKHIDGIQWVSDRLPKGLPVSDAVSCFHGISDWDGFWFGNPCDMNDAREAAAHHDFIPDLEFFKLIDQIYQFLGVLSVVEVYHDNLEVTLANSGLGWQPLYLYKNLITINRLKSYKCYDDLCRILVADALVGNTVRTLYNVGFLYSRKHMSACGLAIMIAVEDDTDIVRQYDETLRNEAGGNMLEVAYQCTTPEIKKKLRQLVDMPIDTEEQELLSVIRRRASAILGKDSM